MLPVLVSQTAAHLKFNALPVSASQGPHHSLAPPCSVLVANHCCLIIMESLHL